MKFIWRYVSFVAEMSCTWSRSEVLLCVGKLYVCKDCLATWKTWLALRVYLAELSWSNMSMHEWRANHMWTEDLLSQCKKIIIWNNLLVHPSSIEHARRDSCVHAYSLNILYALWKQIWKMLCINFFSHFRVFRVKGLYWIIVKKKEKKKPTYIICQGFFYTIITK